MAQPSSSSLPSTRTTSPTKDEDTPPSSLPSDMPESKDEGDAEYGVSEAMHQEEERMRKVSDKEEATRQKKLEQDRENDMKGGSEAVDSKFKALEYLLSQSKVYTHIEAFTDAI